MCWMHNTSYLMIYPSVFQKSDFANNFFGKRLIFVAFDNVTWMSFLFKQTFRLQTHYSTPFELLCNERFCITNQHKIRYRVIIFYSRKWSYVTTGYCATCLSAQVHLCQLFHQVRSGGRFKNAYELLNLRALEISMLYKNLSFNVRVRYFVWILRGIFEISHKIFYPYIERRGFFSHVKI